jgi:hypothetical protein
MLFLYVQHILQFYFVTLRPSSPGSALKIACVVRVQYFQHSRDSGDF